MESLVDFSLEDPSLMVKTSATLADFFSLLSDFPFTLEVFLGTLTTVSTLRKSSNDIAFPSSASASESGGEFDGGGEGLGSLTSCFGLSLILELTL